MNKVVSAFGVATLVSGLFLTLFSLAVTSTKLYYEVNTLQVFGEESRSRSLYYDHKPTSNITLDVIAMISNKTGSISIRIIGSGVDERQTLVNWTGCSFRLPPEPSGALIAYVDNNSPESILVYFISHYAATELDYPLTYAGFLITSLGVLEIGASFIKASSASKSSLTTRGKES